MYFDLYLDEEGQLYLYVAGSTPTNASNLQRVGQAHINLSFQTAEQFEKLTGRPAGVQAQPEDDEAMAAMRETHDRHIAELNRQQDEQQ